MMPEWTPYREMARWRHRFFFLLFLAAIGAGMVMASIILR